MNTPADPPLPLGDYHAYLVRLWRDDSNGPWRASTQCVQTGEKRFFADLTALWVFLSEQTQAPIPGDRVE